MLSQQHQLSQEVIEILVILQIRMEYKNKISINRQIIQSLMRQVRQQRITSLQSNKENQCLPNNSQLNNLPSLRNNNKPALKNEYQLHLHQRKKTYLNLYTKKDTRTRDAFSKNGCDFKKPVETARLLSDQTLSTQMSGVYFSSRADRNNYRSTGRPACSQKYQILEKHEINIKMRAKMIDWLLQISSAYKCKNQTLFLAIFLMDEYFAGSERSLGLCQLHLIGVTCIYMACKYEQIQPIRMKTLVRDIAHNKITVREVINKEAEILLALDFRFQRKCVYITTQEILFQICRLIPHSQVELLQTNLQYFLKLIAFDCDLLRKQNTQLLAKGAILASIRSMPEATKNLQLYDSFITSCGRDYENSHHICSQILFLNANFKSEFGKVQNIHKICPLAPKNTLDSYAL